MHTVDMVYLGHGWYGKCEAESDSKPSISMVVMVTDLDMSVLDMDAPTGDKPYNLNWTDLDDDLSFPLLKIPIINHKTVWTEWLRGEVGDYFVNNQKKKCILKIFLCMFILTWTYLLLIWL